MEFKINDVQVPVLPKRLVVTTHDLDDDEGTRRSASGTLIRSRIAIKRKIEAEWPVMKWQDVSVLLNLVKDPFFQVKYPDPLTGQYETKTFYCANRPAGVAIKKDNEIYWQDIQLNLIER